jgi:ABC-type Fe3+/spermidine/putrescine transport system ATPase subunit
MQKGVAQQIGTPEEIYHAPANLFVMSFIGASNALSGLITAAEDGKIQVTGDNWQLWLIADFAPQLPVGTAVHLAFRPEHGRLQFNGTPDQKRVGEFVGEVQSVEFGGSHWLVQCKIGAQICFVRVPAEGSANELFHTLMNGRKARITVQPQHIRLFPANAT